MYINVFVSMSAVTNTHWMVPCMGTKSLNDFHACEVTVLPHGPVKRKSGNLS